MARGLSDRWERLNGPARLAGVDLARGLAVIGMFAAHLLTTAESWVWGDPSTWLAVVDGRSSILFATLAGVSIGLVTGGPVPSDGDRMRIARGRLAVRAGMLWLIGILLILTGVPVYVILPAYALLFVLALPFARLSAGAVLAAAAAIGVVMAFVQPLLDELPLWYGPFGEEIAAALGWHYPFPVWLAFVLTGLGVARADLRRLPTQLWMLGAGALLALLGYAGLPADASSLYLQEVLTSRPHSSGLYEVIGTGGFAVAVLGGCLLICRLGAVRMLVLPLRATGAMPLTAYTAQLLIWAVVALAAVGDTGDLFAFRALDPFWPLTIGVVLGCTAWALLVGRGPLEWLLDRTAKLVVPSRPDR
ncbi:heparan-alpha-glucosaminide N-acetyltransferase domain-containing protein [Microbacterium sp. CIAB417]|uniref:heparan-alpha-glucosaminide N-acetyltransferase domain-containing protein n=1 Tax=Microbacterium sp. CIAB417 TaxID=2860287 RepID=UPI001FAC4E6B|nr:heparan-alpha-glucosaminide N-acetyltransferase domain-containing protein [Microbacterium sp. CIAB417]